MRTLNSLTQNLIETLTLLLHARQVLRVTRHQKSILAEQAFQLCLNTNKETWTAI